MLINKFTTGEKVPRTLVVLKMAIQFREKKIAYTIFKWKFTCSTDKPHVIKNVHHYKGTKAVIFISLKNIPKTTNNAAHVLPVWREFVLHCKSIPVGLNWKNILFFYGSQPTSKVGSHRLHYCEDILFHLSQFMTKFTFEQCLSLRLLFKLAKKSRRKFSCSSYKAFFIFHVVETGSH